MTDTPQTVPFELKHRWGGRVLFTSPTAKTIGEAVLEALKSGADLRGADLSGAVLSGANLSHAVLSGANLSHANLRDANLSHANLRDANLSHANLRDANLSHANLSHAVLSGANPSGANPSGADLSGADLKSFRRDIELILYENPREVTALLGALKGGRVDGSYYVGECCCLVGTIAKARGCDIDSLVSGRDSSRPAEQWFTLIKPGDTPDKSNVTKLTVEWVRAWRALQTADLYPPRGNGV